MHRAVTRGHICWNCKWSRFRKRQGDLVGRGRGKCYLDSGEPPFPRMWNFPENVDIENVPDDPGVYLSETAPLSSELSFMDKELSVEDHRRREEVVEEHGYLIWIRDHLDAIIDVSWQDTCVCHDFQ